MFGGGITVVLVLYEMLTRDGVVKTTYSQRIDADWLRISAANRLAKHCLSTWAALWLWRLRTDTSPAFWRAVGRAAERLGYPAYVPPETIMPLATADVTAVLEELRLGEPPLGPLGLHELSGLDAARSAREANAST